MFIKVSTGNVESVVIVINHNPNRSHNLPQNHKNKTTKKKQKQNKKNSLHPSKKYGIYTCSNIQTSSENVKLICISYINRYKSQSISTFSVLFNSKCISILLFLTLFHSVCHVKDPQNNYMLSSKSRNRGRSYRLWWCPLH